MGIEWHKLLLGEMENFIRLANNGFHDKAKFEGLASENKKRIIALFEEQQREIEHLEQGHVGMLEAHGKLNREVENLFMAYEGQRKVNNRLREVLEFYAERNNFKTFDSPAVKDYGEKARQALEG